MDPLQFQALMERESDERESSTCLHSPSQTFGEQVETMLHISAAVL